MKEIYEKPITDVEKFEKVDIVTISFPTDDNDVTFPQNNPQN